MTEAVSSSFLSPGSETVDAGGEDRLDRGGELEGSPAALQTLLGHAALAMTMRYAHLSQGHLRDEIARTERPAAGPSLDSKQTASNSRETLLSETAVA